MEIIPDSFPFIAEFPYLLINGHSLKYTEGGHCVKSFGLPLILSASIYPIEVVGISKFKFSAAIFKTAKICI